MNRDSNGGGTDRWVLALIAAGLLVWGCLFALGVFLDLGSARPETDRTLGIEKGLIVLGCTLAFLGFWGLALWNRGRRLRRKKRDSVGNE